MIRFELERALISGALAVADLPDAWSAATREALGVAPWNDAEGCLQDGHWADGMIGYFPTYTLGDVFAAQLYACAELELGEPGRAVRAGRVRRAGAVAGRGGCIGRARGTRPPGSSRWSPASRPTTGRWCASSARNTRRCTGSERLGREAPAAQPAAVRTRAASGVSSGGCSRSRSFARSRRPNRCCSASR